MSDYRFTTEPHSDGTMLRWTKDGAPQDPLDFWIVPPRIKIEVAKNRVRAGEFGAPTKADDEAVLVAAAEHLVGLMKNDTDRPEVSKAWDDLRRAIHTFKGHNPNL